MIFLYDFPTDTEGALSSSTEEGNYPLINIRNTILSKYFQFTGKTSEYIQFSIDNQFDFDAIGIITNITATGTITIKGYNIIDGGSASVHPTDIIDGNGIYYTIATLSGADCSDRGLILYQFGATYSTEQILLIEFADTNNTENIIVKRLVFGMSVTLGKFQPKLQEQIFNTGIPKISRSGAIYGTIGYAYHIYSFIIANITATQRLYLKSMISEIGNYTPFFIDFTEDITINYPDYCILNSDNIGLILQDWMNYTGNIELRQAF